MSGSPKSPEDLDAPTMVEALRRLVEAESFSADPRALEQCAELLDSLCREILGRGVERLPEGCLAWHRPGDRPVLLLCHYDTVWPTGTLQDFPFSVENGTARGPGVFDMKGGIIQALFALSVTDGPVTLLLTPDEEVGSPRSRRVIEEHARGSRAALVLEPAADNGGIKVARKGVAHWRIRIWGRAAHAGLEPEKGVNALVELAEQIRRIGVLARPDVGTSVAVTRAGGGTAENVIPESAWCEVDARMWTLEEGARLEQAMEGLAPVLPGVRLEVEGGVNRGPLERAMSEPLYRRLQALGYELPAVEVGGGSDASFTAAMGVPTLDGLGAVGGGAHARSEHLVLAELPRRAEMLARLMEDLFAHG